MIPAIQRLYLSNTKTILETGNEEANHEIVISDRRHKEILYVGSLTRRFYEYI